MRHSTTTTTLSAVQPTSNVLPLNNMESLQLPAELYWDGKSEPNTPPSSELFSIVDYSIAENWIDEDNIAIEIIDNENLKTIEDACELLSGDELDKELGNIKENWTNAKPQPPLQNYVDEYMVDFTQTNPLSKVLFQNSIDGYNSLPGIGVDDLYMPVAHNLDNAILTQLTPPQSPPLNNNNIITNTQLFFSPDSQFNIIEQQPILLPTQQEQQEQQEQSTFVWNNTSTITASLPIVQATENYIQTQIVDEIVKTRAQELSDWSDEFEALSTSSISSFSASINTDEDYVPQDSQQQEQPIEIATTSNGSRKRRPYGRAIEDRKVRKKEQNKNAATRYRQKKKQEMEVVLSEEHNLLQRHEELKRELIERRKEAKYLKTLLREFHQKQQQLKQKS